MVNDRAISGAKIDSGFEITLQNGKSVSGKKLIFATGIKDELLNIPGFSACWGISVVHCPYCHGFEYRERKTAILAHGDAAMHYAMLVGNLTKDLTIFTNGGPDFSDEQLTKLNGHHIKIINTEVTEIEHEAGHIRHVRLKDGERISFDALYFKPPFKQHSAIPEQLGCELNEQGYLKIDQTQKTTVDGIYACGDNSSVMRSVANAVATGNFTGAVVNKELASEHF
jgi:thioredoxin reductase